MYLKSVNIFIRAFVHVDTADTSFATCVVVIKPLSHILDLRGDGHRDGESWRHIRDNEARVETIDCVVGSIGRNTRRGKNGLRDGVVSFSDLGFTVR